MEFLAVLRSVGDHPNRFHAACRDTASASPMVAQLTSRSRRMSAISCIAAPILSKAPLYPAKVFNNASVGALPGSSEGTSCVVGLPFFSMIGRQSSTHSSQIKTPGPATSVFTSVCAFPQKEQWYSRRKARVVFASGIGLSFRQRWVDSQPCVDAHVNLVLTGRSRGSFEERRCRIAAGGPNRGRFELYRSAGHGRVYSANKSQSMLCHSGQRPRG
jgi:hypothetical protein